MQFSGLTRPASAFCLDNNNAKEQANCKTKQKSNCLAKQQQQCVHKFNNERTKELQISVHTSSFTHRFNETKRKKTSRKMCIKLMMTRKYYYFLFYKVLVRV